MSVDLYSHLAETESQLFKLVSIAVQQLRKKFPNHCTIPPVETWNKIYSFLEILDSKRYEVAFLKGLKAATGKFCNSADRGWGCIATCLSDEANPQPSFHFPPTPTPGPGDLRKHNLPPSLYPAEKRQAIPRATPKPKKRGRTRAGHSWILNRRWPHLWKSSQLLFFELVRRYQYTKRPGAFPWCQAGIRSLSKFTGYSSPQVKRALHQLQRYGLIKRIVRGYKERGASKYLIFLTPAMSGAFKVKSLRAKKYPHRKKRIPAIR